MIEHIEYQGFIIVTINGWFHVYEPIALAYIGEHNPPEEMYLAEFEDIEEAKAYITTAQTHPTCLLYTSPSPRDS